MSLSARERLIGAGLLVLPAVAVGVVVVHLLGETFVPAAVSTAPSCQGEERKVGRPLPAATVVTEQWGSRTHSTTRAST